MALLGTAPVAGAELAVCGEAEAVADGWKSTGLHAVPERVTHPNGFLRFHFMSHANRTCTRWDTPAQLVNP